MHRLRQSGLATDLSLFTLTPNTQAIERALKARAENVAIFGAASEGFSQKVSSVPHYLLHESLLRSRTQTAAKRKAWTVSVQLLRLLELRVLKSVGMNAFGF